MKEIELKLIAPNQEAVRSVRELAAESNKLHTNNEKHQKRQVGLIQDVEKELDRLQKAQKEAMTIEHIEKYNKKIAEAKQALEEYNKAGVETKKQTETLTGSISKWVLGLGGATAALALIKNALLATTTGLNAFNIAAAAAKQVMYNLVTGASSLTNGLMNVIIAQKELNALRLQEKRDMFDATKQRIVYNQKLVEAHDQLKTGAERIKAYDDALEAHNKRIDIETKSIQDRIAAIREMAETQPDNEKLVMEYWDLQTRLLGLESERFAGQKEISSMRSGLVKKEIQDELDWRKNLHDTLQRLADEEIEINEAKTKERIQKEHELLIESYTEKRDMFWNYLGEIEKANDEAAKAEAKRVERWWNLETEYANNLHDQLDRDAKIKWDAILEGEEKAKQLAEDLKEGRAEALREGLNTLYDFTQKIADRELEDAQRHRELLDQRINETLMAIQAETNIQKEGYASNVAAKKKELEDLKKQRDKALKDEEAALQRKRLMESVAQGINIFSSSTNILKESTKMGPLGVLLAAGAIAAMFTLLSSVKRRAAEIKLAHGGHGEVRGKLHSEGGERFGDHIEVEGGEAWGVLSRPATRKYGKVFKDMVDSFNKDKLPVPKGGIMLNNISVQNDGPNKRLDEVNSNLRRISSKEEVLTSATAVIYRKGSNTRIIRK